MDVILVNCIKNIEIYIFCDDISYFSDMTVISQVSLITTGVHMGQIGTLVYSLIMMNIIVQPCTEVMTKTMIHMIVMHGMILNVQIKWKLFVKLRSTTIPQHQQPHPQRQQQQQKPLLHQQLQQVQFQHQQHRH